MHCLRATTLATRALRQIPARAPACTVRYISATPIRRAIAQSADVQGPPPDSPTNAVRDRLEWKNKKEELIRSKKEKMEPITLTRRFWKDVSVKEVPEGYQIMLDQRFVRAPTDKSIVTIPHSKPHLAHGIALEWDSLTLAKHALKPHLIPLTGLYDRTLDIVREDAQGTRETRDDVLNTVMRYLDTDTLLCWEPGESAYEHPLHETPKDSQPNESLRDLQVRTAQRITSHLLNTVWPGIQIVPVFQDDSIFPTPQAEPTKAMIRSWIAGLPPYDLAGLERATLASKSLLIAARLVIEWSENFRHLQSPTGDKTFTIEDAALAATTEVTWQTTRWGEVEDTHDVDKEDIRRQLGSVVVLVSGTK
ncbi:ATP synthase complex assembly protein atp12 [Ascosphaera atra]|nr:ATP synthase complex assembly protein atp12 [Ascosphaera atra]